MSTVIALISKNLQSFCVRWPDRQNYSSSQGKNACHLGTRLAYTHDVRRFILLTFLCGCGLTLSTIEVRSEGLAPSETKFYYRTPAGAAGSARIIRHYWTVPVIHPDARVDSRLDPRMCRAATIAEERANARSKARCWRYVKEALVAAGVIDSYPKTNYAADAGKSWCAIMVLSASRCATNSLRQLVPCWSFATAAKAML